MDMFVLPGIDTSTWTVPSNITFECLFFSLMSIGFIDVIVCCLCAATIGYQTKVLESWRKLCPRIKGLRFSKYGVNAWAWLLVFILLFVGVGWEESDWNGGRGGVGERSDG